MNRLFQHYEGEITSLEGLTLKGLSLLIDDDSEQENIILLWLQTEDVGFLRPEIGSTDVFILAERIYVLVGPTIEKLWE